MENLTKDSAGIFKITTQNDKIYIGFSMELQRKIEAMEDSLLFAPYLFRL